VHSLVKINKYMWNARWNNKDKVQFYFLFLIERSVINMLFGTVAGIYATFEGYEMMTETARKWYWRYKLLSWAYRGVKKVKSV